MVCRFVVSLIGCTIGACLPTMLLPAAEPTQPFGNEPAVIPGKIEAEHYDRGEPGVAYHDVDPENQGADYREATQVDIEQRTDASNGHGVGWTRKGEWLKYQVHVTDDGVYNLEIPVASHLKGGTFHIEFDGRDVTGPIDVPDTGGWDKLQQLHKSGVKLKAGPQTMKLVMDSEGPSGSIADIDYVRFAKSEPNGPDNELTQAEKDAGWQLLFNGKDHTGWLCNNGKPVATPIDQASLVPYKSGGYLILHEKEFGDFVLRCDVKWEARSCNSGIFLRVSDPRNPVHTGFEIQVMSGQGTGKHDFGAVYDLAAPVKNLGRPAGQWNQVEIRCQGPEITVKLNGEMVTEMNCDDFTQPGLCPDGKRHKFKLDGQPRAVRDFARVGQLGFQDHGQKVWYKNVKLLELTSGS